MNKSVLEQKFVNLLAEVQQKISNMIKSFHIFDLL